MRCIADSRFGIGSASLGDACCCCGCSWGRSLIGCAVGMAMGLEGDLTTRCCASKPALVLVSAANCTARSTRGTSASAKWECT